MNLRSVPVVIKAEQYVARLVASPLRVRFVSGLSWSLIGAVTSRGLTLLSAIVVGRILGTSKFGEFAVIQDTIGLFGVIAASGLGLTVIKFVSEYRSTDPARAGNYIGLTVELSLISGVLSAVGLAGLSVWIANRVLAAPHLAADLRLSTGLVIFGTINGVQLGAIIGLEDFKRWAAVSAIRGILLVVFVVTGGATLGVTGAVGGAVLAEMSSALVNFVSLRRVCQLRQVPILYSHRSWKDVKKVWQFAIPATLGSLVIMPAMWLSSVILVNQPNGYRALGIFDAADRWRQLILFLPSSIAPMILPMLSNLHGLGARESFKKVFYTNLALNFVISLIPAFGLALISRFAMGLYGNGYDAGWLTLIILSGVTIASTLNIAMGQGIVSLGLIWWRFSLDVVLAVLLIVGSLGFIPAYQENGLALANLFAYWITVLALFLVVRTQFAKHGVL